MSFQHITPENICVCIPARYASTRLHGKLLFDIGGQTVLERTCRQALKCQWVSQVFILTDHEAVAGRMKEVGWGDRVTVILHNVTARNGTERIGKNLEFIPEEYSIIVNIQGDEPFVDPRNVDFAIEKHVRAQGEGVSRVFFTTLHQEITDVGYLHEPSCVKIIANRQNDAMLFTRNVVPWNKDGVARPGTRYYSCTGVYVFNRARVAEYATLRDTDHQLEEDVEQMKVLDHGFVIKTYEAPFYNEISVNTSADYDWLLLKHGFCHSPADPFSTS